MKVKCVSGDSSFVHKHILLNAGMSMAVDVLVPHISGVTFQRCNQSFDNIGLVPQSFHSIFFAQELQLTPYTI